MIRLLFFCCLLFAARASAQNIRFVEYELPNGLKVLLHEDHTTPIVAVSVMYHVGSKNENPERTGFAHFFEHLLFEGSENIQRGQFDAYINDAGGYNNANTTYDRTFYFETLPSNQLALGLWLESERMLHARVEPVGIETQRQVVKEERRQSIDNQPYAIMYEASMSRAFRKHPYRFSVIGSMEHLDAAREEDYRQFYRDFYRPDNAILSIAGDIDIAQTQKLIDIYFRDIPRGQGPIFRPDIVEPPLGGEVRDTVFDNVQLPAIALTYRTPALGTRDYYAVKMLSQLLSQGESSRLKKTVVDAQEKAAMIQAFPLDLEDPGVVILFAVANVGVAPDELEKSMDTVIDDVQANLIPEKEFQKLQNQLENDFILANNTMAGIAENLANYEMYYGDANLINTELERYRQVTREDLRRVAGQYFRRDNRVVLYCLPHPPKP